MDGDLDDAPSFFICPISLQIMKDPVTISTGMTFDRESIQNWLFSYKRITCPITKQLLTNFTLTPNSTLLRLIQSWNLQQKQSSPSPKSVDAVQKPEQQDPLQLLLQEIEKPHLQVRSLIKIKSLIQENDGYRNSCLANSLFTILASVLVTKFDHESTVIDETVSMLCLLNPSQETLKTVSENEDGLLIELLSSTMIQYMSTHVRIQAALLLKSVFKVVDGIYKTRLKDEFFFTITDILKDQNSKKGTIAVLGILMEVLGFGKNKEKAVNGGIVQVLVELLAESNERKVCEMMLVVLEKLCRTADGRAGLLGHPIGLAAVLSKILRVSHVGNEKVISLLLWVFRFCKSGEVEREFMEVGGVAKICLVVQGGSCSVKTQDKVREILGIHLKNWKSSPCFPPSFRNLI